MSVEFPMTNQCHTPSKHLLKSVSFPTAEGWGTPSVKPLQKQ